MPKLSRFLKKPSLLRIQDRLLLQAARQIRPDLVLVLPGVGFNLRPEVLQELKRQCAGPLVSWWVDDPFRDSVSSELFACFDHLFIFDRSYLPPLQSSGARNVHFLPCACDETAYRPREVGPWTRRRLESDVSFVACFSPERARIVRALAGELRVGVWGGGWQSPDARRLLNGGPRAIRGGIVDDHQASLIYSSSKIGLNVHHGQSRQGGLNTRTFELLAAGLPPLTDQVPGLEELLLPDREVICYGSPEEALRKARQMLSDPGLRQRVARAGRDRVLSEHTYVHRMRTLCELSRA